MIEHEIYCIIVDKVDNMVYIRPTNNIFPSYSQKREVSDWAIENGYNEEIIIDMVYAIEENKINKIAFVPSKNSNMAISGWILPNGEVVNIRNEDHYSYVRNNPEKFNLNNPSESFSNNGYNIEPHYISEKQLAKRIDIMSALEQGAIRFYKGNKNTLELQCNKKALSQNILMIHDLYKKSGAYKIYLDLIINGKPSIEISLDSIEELYTYASKNSWYKTSSKQPKITKQERIKIEQFVNKIKKGYHNWIDNDVQLYQNNAELIEKMLKGEKVNWNNVVEEEFEKSLRELEELMRE